MVAEKTDLERESLLKNAIIDCIDSELYLKKFFNKENEFSHYEGEIFIDRGDEGLDKKTIEKILDSDSPMEEFYSIVDEFMLDSEWYDRDYIVEEIQEKLHRYFDDEEFDLQDNVEVEDFIRDFVQDCVIINYPYDFYLNQDINVNICTDFYDEKNTDFTCNSFRLNGIPYKEKLERGSVTWLVNSQGYTMKEFYDAYNRKVESESKFINSLVEEIENSSYCMNILTFFVKMNLKEVIEYKENPKKLHILKSTNCGLYNPWKGAGGCLDIKLEKDIHINPKNVYSLDYDGALGYSVESTFGVWGGFWQ